MATRTRSVRYEFNGDARGLEGAVTRANRSLTGLNKSTSTLKSSLAGLATGVGIAGLTRVTKAVIDNADAIAKTARTVGFLPEEYQKLSFAASQSGVDISVLNSSLTAFTKRVGEAGQGSGQLLAFLKKYDQALADSVLGAKTQEEALSLIFDAMTKTTSATERAAIANAAFSRSGLKLSLIADNYDTLANRAEDLGLVLSDDILASAERAGDELDILSKTVKANLTVALADAIPVLGAAAVKISELVSAIPALGLQLGIIDPENITNIQTLNNQLEKLQQKRATLISQQEDLTNFNPFEAGDLREFLAAFNPATDTVKEGLAEVDAEIKKIQDSILKAQGIDPALLAQGIDAEQQLRIKADEKVKQQKLANSAAAAQEQLALAQQTADKMAAKQIAAQTKADTQIARIQAENFKELDRLTQLNFEIEGVEKLQAFGLTADEARIAIERLRRETLEEIEIVLPEIETDAKKVTSLLPVEKAIEESETIADAIKSASRDWSSSLADDLLSSERGFENFAESVLEQLAKIALTKALDPLFDAFEGFLDGFGSGGGSGGIGSIFSSIFGGKSVNLTGAKTELVATGGGAAKMVVNVKNSPSTPEVKQSTGPNGESMIDIIYNEVNSRQATEIANGGGLWGAISSRGGLQEVVG